MTKETTLSEKAAALKDAANAPPSQGEVVKTPTKLIEIFTQPNDKGTGTYKVQVHQFPLKGSCKDTGNNDRSGRIEFRNKTGYSSPYYHLKWCNYYRDMETMIDAYWQAKATQRQQAVMETFLPRFIKSADTSINNNSKQDPYNINPDMPPLLSKK